MLMRALVIAVSIKLNMPVKLARVLAHFKGLSNWFLESPF